MHRVTKLSPALLVIHVAITAVIQTNFSDRVDRFSICQSVITQNSHLFDQLISDSNKVWVDVVLV
jgi:hypothetical protein